MCGIAGIWNRRGRIGPGVLSRFSASLRHRGPDAEGEFVSDCGALGLAHKRLSVLGVGIEGRQPMTCPTGRYSIAFDGEIHNFLEIRRELQSFGVRFETQTDTEVVIASFAQWGSDCLQRFNGMWAIAIWDSLDKRLFLARDRFGVKPLYYLNLPEQLFAFASETTAFASLDHFRRRLDPRMVATAIDRVYDLEGYGRTIFRQVRQVLPGHFLLVENDGALSEKRWWSTLDHLQPPQEEHKDRVAQFRALFDDACRIRLRSDVPLGTALSGGLDSSSILSTVHRLTADPDRCDRVPRDCLRAVSMLYPRTVNVDEPYVREVERNVGCEVVFVEASMQEILDDMWGETVRRDYIASSLHVEPLLYKAMRGLGLTVSLDGHGADEMLFGYPSLVRKAHAFLLQSNDHAAARRIEGIFSDAFPESRLRPSADGRSVDDSSRDPWLTIQPIPRPRPFESQHADWRQLSILDREVYVGFHETVLPTLLRVFDRAAMAHGVEIRTPFLDWRLVTAVLSMPLESRLGGGFTKRVLRDAMKERLPAKVLGRRKKIGFRAPMVEWFKSDLASYVRDLVDSQSFRESDVWDGRRINHFVQQKTKGKSWRWKDCERLWPFLSAHVLFEEERRAKPSGTEKGRHCE